MSQQLSSDISAVWTPLPGTSQEIALDTRCHHTLYTGSRGPGKSDTQLMRFRRRVGIGYGSFWRGIILDREFKNLDDLVQKSKRWFNEFNDGAVFLTATNAYKWVWPTGEELLFRTAKTEDDYWAFHGQEFAFIGWNELTKYPTGKLYSMFMSCNRSSWTQEKNATLIRAADGVFDVPEYDLPPIPLEVFSTTNPWGAGHAWVKAQFIDPAPYGVVVRNTVRVFDPGLQIDVDVERTQVAIFGSYKENKYLSAVYVATLHAEKDENLRKAWLQGSWDVAVGGAFSDVWKQSVHIVPRFKVPANWRLDRTFDWGSSHPFWIGWWAESNGEEVTVVMPDGTKSKFCPPPKSYILVHEKYGTENIGTNEGVRWSAAKIADEIVKIEKQLRDEGWIASKVNPGPADNQISNKTQSDEQTIAKKMEAKKVKWTKSDKSKGSRINGFQLMRDRLEAAVENSGPAIYTMVHNRASIAIIPTLPRDTDNPDDVDCFVAGTMIATDNGAIAIEKIPVGTLVWTPLGLRPATKVYRSGLSPTVRITLSTGAVLEGTPHHKVYVRGHGLVPLAAIVEGLTLMPMTSTLLPWKNSLSTTEFDTFGRQDGCIIALAGNISLSAILAFIDRFGRTLMAIFQQSIIYTTLTGTPTITALKIWSAWKRRHTPSTITSYEWKAVNSVVQWLRGETVKKDSTSLEQMLLRCARILPNADLRALIVETLLLRDTRQKSTAVTLANLTDDYKTTQRDARYAVSCFRGSAPARGRPEPVVISVVGCSVSKPVFNLTVEQAHLYYANGVLVTNTDSEDHPWDGWRYKLLASVRRAATALGIGHARSR